MERERFAVRRYSDLIGGAHELEYWLLSRGGRYGVEIRDRAGEDAKVEDLTTRRERAEQVLELLARNLVTPVTLRDVIDDLL